MPISTIVVFYRGGQLSWCRKSEKTTNLQKVAENHMFIMSALRHR